MNPAMIVMCKAPAAGTVKTRLAPFLSAEKAADLAGCFAVDTLKKAQNICENTIVAFIGEKEMLETILPQNLIWVRQTGADLGERMHNALRFAFEQNFSPLVVIGTDSPTLPSEYIKVAIKILQEKLTDAVIGETEDGG
ncbi:MAG TPA: TIGR04282 family arsenosugar biosynthesis glycosyltransferase, partial [Pyrinomonadaceae bacterium]|nr:TIGR04282 family arsenosugar biosynthesis glycosyltransferase [Pyrinomonadaceae bacterium]